jgi:hypothetical protein
MNTRLFFRLFFLTVAVLSAAACQNEPTAAGGKVKASEAYLTHFGGPPVPEKGQCYARVGFYPLKEAPEKVGAVPLFLFEEKNQLQLLLERLVSAEIDFPARSPLFNPFPPGSSVRLASRAGDTAEVELILKGSSKPENLSAMAAALTETVVQFEDIEQVRIVVNGTPLEEMPANGFAHDAGRIAPPGPPALLLTVGTWEDGALDPKEILADFDRPVTIESFTLTDASGQKIKGDYFTSAFDMAVVIHPDNPSSLKEGMALRAEWQVVDRLGRKGEGTGNFTLGRHDHDEGH